ncbi:MAG: histidine kinase [Bacteroidia bacterium]|nr:histidine kinase [Bacteroidia bacterium]
MERFSKYRLDHVIFWLATVLFHAYTRFSLLETAGWGPFVSEIVVRNLLLAAAIYVNLELLIPRLVSRGRYLAYILFFALNLGGYVSLKNFHDVYLYGHVLNDTTRAAFWPNSFYNFSIGLFYLAFSVALHLSKEWFVQKRMIEKIKLEQLNTELAYLKSQINPHFLFNSINTIYFQIDKKNVQARETLSRFSDMLRYQLYECNGHEIALEKEVNYIRNYVELQRMRKDENFQIQVQLNDDFTGATIAPLLLIPLVENAFKYVSNFSRSDNTIRIRLSREGKEFSVVVFNTTESSIANAVEHGGIGLQNVRRRLALLYPDRHTLQIDKNEGAFEVKLKLQLT